MEKHNFVTIADLTKEKILYMIEMAQEFEQHPNRELLKGKVVATLFFEPSTRTRLSFETAANRLGARVIGFADPKITSGTKGETLSTPATEPTSTPPSVCSISTASTRHRVRSRTLIYIWWAT